MHDESIHTDEATTSRRVALPLLIVETGRSREERFFFFFAGGGGDDRCDRCVSAGGTARRRWHLGDALLVQLRHDAVQRRWLEAEGKRQPWLH